MRIFQIEETIFPIGTVRGQKKNPNVILLAFHEFLSKSLHIYRGGSSGSEVFLGTQKFRFLTHKSNIFGKW